MKAFVSTLSRFLYRLLSVIIALAITVLSLSVLSQIVTRELFGFSILPLDDIIPYVFSISTFAGAAMLFKEKGHIAISVISDFMPDKLRRFALIFSEVVTAAFLVFFVYYGIEFWLDGRYQHSPLLAMRMIYVYTIIPVAGISGLVFLLDNCLSPESEPSGEEPDVEKPAEAL